MKAKKIMTGSRFYNRFARFLVLACLLFGFGSAWATTIYLDAKNGSGWNTANAWFWAHTWGDGSDYDVKLTSVGNGIYSCDVPDSKTNVIFVRMNPSSSNMDWNNGKWNQTTDLDIPTNGNNMFTPTGWDNSGGNWSKYSADPDPGPTPDPTPAIKCDPQNTKVIFQENFDFPELTDDKSRCSYLRTQADNGYDAWVPAKGSSGAQGYTYMEACKAMKDNGYYAVVVNAQWGGCGDQYNTEPYACACDGSKWFRDVTSRSGSGGMLMYNANNGTESTPDILYACKVDVCADTYINFTAHIAPANALRPGTNCENNYDDAAVKFVLRDSETQQILATQTISDIKLTAGWQELSAMFKSGAAKNGEKEKSVTIEFVNIAPAGNCGNDLLIDDITLSVCTPSASLTTSNGASENTIISGMSETLTANLLSGIMDNPYYLWQKQVNKAGWQPVNNAQGQPVSGVNVKTVTVIPENTTVEYRVIVAPSEEAALDVAFNRNVDEIPCGMYAITNTATITTKPIEVTINKPAAICEGKNAQFVITVKNPLGIAISNVKLRVIPPTVMENNAKAEPTASYDANKREWTIASLQGSQTFTYEAIPTGVGHLNFQAHISAIGNDITYISYDDPTLPPASKAISSIDVERIVFDVNPVSVSNACEDSEVIFTTKAQSSCNGTVTYQWVRRVKDSSDDFTAISGATGTTYTISKLTKADAAYEYAVWANVSGCPCKNVLSNTATITFVPKTTVPTDITPYLECQTTGTKLLKELVKVDNPNNLVFYETENSTTPIIGFDRNEPINTTYYFTYQETGKCASNRGDVSVEVLATPVAKITSSSEQEICTSSEKQDFSVSATSENGTGAWEVFKVVNENGVELDKSVVSINNASSASTTITLPKGTVATINWRVVARENKCDAVATTTLKAYEKPVIVFDDNSGTQAKCFTRDFTVAVKPHAGKGVWTFVGESHGATIQTANNIQTEVTNVPEGATVNLLYTATNGNCESITANCSLTNEVCNKLSWDELDANPEKVCLNKELTLTFVVKNSSTVTSTNVIATIALPQGLAYVSTEEKTGNYANGTWEMGDVQVGATATLKLRVKSVKVGTQTVVATITKASNTTLNIEKTLDVTVNALPTAKFNAASSEICGSINESSAIGVTLTGKAPYTLTYTLDGVEKTDSRVYSPHSIAQSLTNQKDYQFALTKVVDSNGCEADISGETHTLTVDKYAEVGNINEVSAICEDKPLTLPKLPTVTANGSTVSAGKWLLDNKELTSNVLSANDNGKKLQYMVESTCGTQAPKPIYSNEVTVTVDKNPSNAEIALDKIEQCNDPVFNVTANPITVGKGAWSIVSGDVKGISPIDNNVTKVTLADNYIDQAAKVKWTVSNGACESKSDEVELINNNCTAIKIVPNGTGPAVCNGSLATFEFTLTNSSVVDVKDVTLELTLGSGLALQSATASGASFVAGKCVIPSMLAGQSIPVQVQAKATVDKAVVTIKVTKSSNKDVIGVEASQTVTVHSIPTAKFELNNSVVCASEAQNTAIEVDFTGAPNFNLTYTVDNVTKYATSVPNPYIIKESLTGVGSHSIKLVSVKDANQCVGTVKDQEHTTRVEKYATLGTIADVKPICQESVVKLPTEPTIYENGSAISDKKWMLDGTSIDATTLIPYTTETQKLWYQVGSTCGTYTKTIKSNEVDLKVDQKPTIAVAGPKQTQCNDDEFTMAANTPQIGSGKWSVVGSSVLNYEEGNPTTLVKGVPENQSVDLVWTISSKLGVCDASTSTVTLTNNNCTNFNLDVVGDPSQVCPNGTANFNFTLKNTATVAVKNVKLSLTLESGLTLVSAKVESLSFGADNKITIQEMAAGASVNIKVVATADAAANGKKVTIKVEESSGVPVGITKSQEVVVNQPPVIGDIISTNKEIVEGESYDVIKVIDCNNRTLVLNPVILDKDGKPYTGELEYIWTKVDDKGNVIAQGGTGKTESVTSKGYYALEVVDKNTGCVGEKKIVYIDQNNTTPEITNIISYNSIDPGTSEEEKTDILTCSNNPLYLFPTIKSANAVSYAWYKEGDNTVISNSKVLEVGEPGIYTLVVTDKVTGCPSYSYKVTIYEKKFYPDLQDIISTTKPIVEGEEYEEVSVLDCNNQSLILTPDVKRADGSLYPVDSLLYVWEKVDEYGNVIEIRGTGKSEIVTSEGFYELQVFDFETGCPGTKKVIEITEDITTPVITNIISYTTEDPTSSEAKETNVLTCTNDTLYLNPTIECKHPVSYLWSTNDTTKVLLVDKAGIYSLVVTDTITGCATEAFEYEITENKVYPVLDGIISSTKENKDEEGYKETTVLDCNNQSLILQPVIKDEDGNPYTRELEYVWSQVDENGRIIAQGGTGKSEIVTSKGFYELQVFDKETGCPGTKKVIEITEDITTPVITNIISYTTEDPTSSEAKETNVLTCTNDTLYLNPTIECKHPVSYLWSTNDTTKVLLVDKAGIYSLVVTDSITGCATEAFEYEITENKVYPVLDGLISSTKENKDEEGYKETTVLDCNNQSLILQPVIKDEDGNPYTRELEYVWSQVDENGRIIAQGGTGKSEIVTSEGFYELQVFDKETGCPGTKKVIEVTEDITTPVITNIISYTTEDPTSSEAKETKVLTCTNDTLYLNPIIECTHPVSYLWSTNDTTKVLLVDKTGNYSLVATDNITGCATKAFEYEISENKETIDLKLDDVNLCPIDTLSPIKLSELMPKLEGVTYKFFDDMEKPIEDLYEVPQKDEERTYYASAISSNGCSSDKAEFNINFTVLPDFTIEVSESPVLAGGNQSVVTVVPTDADMTIDSYKWIANGKELEVEGTEYVANLYLDTKFVVTASNRCGPTTRDAQVIVVWPTAFTPYNKNGMNETFAKGLPLAIYNRLGIQIFEGQDGWDGIMNKNMGANTMAVPGVYYYAVQLPNGEVKKGTIEIVKF